MDLPRAARSITRVIWRGGTMTRATRVVPEETPVAFTYNRATHAVMLATPSDLEDFAIGFSLAERVIDDPAQIKALEIVALPEGIELRMDLAVGRLDALTHRQRRLAGPSGCGLCGMDSLTDATRAVPAVTADPCFSPEAVARALDAMPPGQHLHHATRAVHAAAFWTERDGIVALREDIGRHNALDKLSGTLVRQGIAAGGGLLLLSSRISVEMVQKAAILGAPVIVAISAPTALAIDVAERANITLIGIARQDGFEIFTHPHRIQPQAVQHVA